VALKVIKLGMDTNKSCPLRSERQALAHDGPSEHCEGPRRRRTRRAPFFVMELVRGTKITDYCDQVNLPMKSGSTLFIQVCRPLQHAHQKGIIHRDLKPSNILVTLHDGVPVPKVIDFGVAKATQQHARVDLSDLYAVPADDWDSALHEPEQAEMSGLDVDTAQRTSTPRRSALRIAHGAERPSIPEVLMRQGYDEIRRPSASRKPQTPSMFLKTMADGHPCSVALTVIPIRPL
jgi:serine/threonine protein kinase